MIKPMLVQAFITQNKIALGNIQASFNTGKLIRKEPSFLLYEIEAKGYLYIKNYGGIVHFNIFPEHIEKINQYICTICQTHLTSFKETLSIRISNEEPINATFDELVIPQITLDYVHIICLNLSQSAALFQYQNLSSGLLEDTQKYTSELELKGHVSLGRKKLMKFIGAALNLKNKISEHLYIFETPTLAWDDQNINKVDQLLNEDLELKYRYNAIKEQLNIVKENLDHFKDLNLHQHSSKLEWIIIILILFEVIHVIIEKII